MESVLGVFGQIGSAKLRSDDDYIDKLNHRYTTCQLIIFAIVVSTKQYVGEPINCWCPAHFTDNHEDFANKMCWVSNTYYVPAAVKRLPNPEDPHARITYYQWVPMILLTQALLFYLPCMFWRFMNSKSGIDVNNVVEAAVTIQNTAYMESRETTIRYMAKHMDRYLSQTRAYRIGFWANCKHFVSRNMCFICGRRYGNYLVVLYLSSKLVYVINVLGQLFVLNVFLGDGYHMYGVDVIQKLLNKESFTDSARFPRVTLCDFSIRTLANIQRHTVQCVLPINLFNEKIYIYVWFWFVFLAIANIFSFLHWTGRAFLKVDQIRYVRNHLRAFERIDKVRDKDVTSKFVRRYLKQDGVIVLRLVGQNTNELVVAELVSELYNIYRIGHSLDKRNGAHDPQMV